MNNQEKIRKRLVSILEEAHCSGLDYPKNGSCLALSESLCPAIHHLDRCTIKLVVDALLSAGVTFPEDPGDES